MQTVAESFPGKSGNLGQLLVTAGTKNENELMRAKTELFLWHLLWLGSVACKPTFRDLSGSFESWVYRQGFGSQLRRLEAEGLIESVLDRQTGRRLHRLTQAGEAAAKGRTADPEQMWARSWDRKWRLFLFDVPEKESAKRRGLTRALQAAGCGCLQGSVWISPLLPEKLEALVRQGEGDCSRLVLLVAESKGRKVDNQMVATAWNFEQINRSYGDYLRVLADFQQLGRTPTKEKLAGWLELARAKWRKAAGLDPFLPKELLPESYRGRDAYERWQVLQPRVRELALALE